MKIVEQILTLNILNRLGISFNESNRVVFRLFFDTTYKKLHFCANDDSEILQSLDSTYDFTQLFRLRLNFNNPLLVRFLIEIVSLKNSISQLNLYFLYLKSFQIIKIKNGPSFSIENITCSLENVNLICLHGNLAVIKTVLLKFIISSDEETAQQYAQNPISLPLPSITQQPSPLDPPPTYNQVASMPVYSGVIVEDKTGHNQHLM